MASTDSKYHVLALGNAIVDVIASAEDAMLAEEGMTKGSMALIEAERAEALYARMGPGREVSGGSAANSLAGIAALGGKCAFIGQVADDQLGEVFRHDIRAAGVDFDVPARDRTTPTGRCLILVTPDGERTMSTFLGASQILSPELVDADLIAASEIVYLEGYLWDPEEPRAAMRRAIAAAKEAGRKVAFTLSDGFVVERHREDILKMIAAGEIDILFANESEIGSLAGHDDFDKAVSETAKNVPLLVVTRSAKGAVAVQDGERFEVAAEPVEKVVDTTGAGDLFAAGVLAGLGQGRSVPDCLKMGAVAAAEIISHFGARPEADLKALVAQKLG